MHEKMTREQIEKWVAQAREFKLGSDGISDLIKFYNDLPLALRMAMFFVPGGPVDPVSPDSRFELEELQLHTFMRMPWQARSDLVRRAEAFLEKTFKVDPATLEPAKPLPAPSELEPLPDGMMMPVDRASTADALRLFRAFVLMNATQWQMGSNHHHPIWALIANHIEGPDPHSGPEYEFIYPTNRQRLAVLLKIDEEKHLDE